MISIVENTGFVIKPYFYYPEILQFVRTLVQNEQSTSIKRLVFKLIGTIGALDPYLVKQIQLYYNTAEGNLDPSADVHNNIPPLLKMIDQHNSISTGNRQEAGEVMGPQSEIERNILKKKFKIDSEASKKINAAAVAAANSNKQAEENADGGANNLVVKDMPMVQFYSQLGPRGQEMIKLLKKYDF